MSNLTEWINYELYPSLFEKIDEVLPEFHFNRYSRGWRSSLKLNLTAPIQPRNDKTVVSKTAPYCLLEQGGDVITIINYVMGRDRTDFIDTIKYLADMVGLRIPNNPNFDRDDYQRTKDKDTLLEDVNNYFIYLLTAETQTEDKDRNHVLNYLTITRSYSLEHIKAMELGYVPSQDRIAKYLQETKKYSPELVAEALPISNDSRIGSTHKVSIPYRSGGVIKGFKFRAIEASPKYLNTTGLDKKGGFFNISGLKGETKDVIIVEGELDCLHATVAGVENVVATGGSSISSEQVIDAMKRGAKKFTICFDREPAKEAETIKNINRAINVILPLSNKIYIATLPDLGGDKTDPDILIKNNGVEEFNNVITKALTYYHYKLQNIINKYGNIQGEKGLTSKDIDNFLDEVVETSLKIEEPINRDQYLKTFITLDEIKQLGITEESLSITVDRLTTTKNKENKNKAFKKLLSETTQLLNKGETDEALELIESKIKEVKLKDKATSFNKLREIVTQAEMKLYFSKAPDSLNSGYTVSGSELLLPAGALTGIAGATNHGKTDFLINLTLNCVNNYKDKEFYFFTYEMSQEAILVRFLNTYLAIDLNNGDSNQREIKRYFKTGSTQYIRAGAKEMFLKKTDEFFKDIIGSGRLKVKGIDYHAPELNLALAELASKGNIGGYFIDYFQLLRLPKEGYKNYSRQEELKVICQDLNTTAKHLKLPVILGAQFNREVTTPFRLHATNIGEAGDIERVLDTLIGIWNTNKKTVTKDMSKAEEIEFKDKGLDKPDKLYTYILKSRETATDIFDLFEYDGKLGIIKNAEKNKLTKWDR